MTAAVPLAGHLDAARWERANRELLAKVLTEFMFEELLAPARTDGDEAAFVLPVVGLGELRFTGRRRALGHWRVPPGSLVWSVDGEVQPLPDVADLLAVAAPALGVTPATTAGALVELANTLLSDVAQLATGRPSAELVDASPTELEGEMRGHPWIVANKGRLGFDVDDLAAYAPEARRPVLLRWLAVAPERADVRTVDGLTHVEVVAEQVGADGWAELRARAAAAGVDPDEVAYVPVHPWQWSHRIVPLHAGDLARGHLVDLGPGPTAYLPQQSIRTMVDADHPDRRTLKLPVSILNTSVYRGLPRARTLAAPALSQWLLGLTRADPVLQASGVVLLGEVASVSVAHHAFSAVAGVPYQHTELLGAIWRESVTPHLGPGERAVTLAALLHRDPAGVPLVAALIERSGLGVAEWVERLHAVTLPPLVHVLYRYGVAFSPHAQNCLLGLVDHAPTRLVVKDFVDDAMVSSAPLPELADLPAAVRAVMDGGLEAPLLVQWIQGGLLVCVHRYLSELLEDHCGYPEARFWAAAARALRTYQEAQHPSMEDRFGLFDLEAPAFVKLCLNRVRLLERGYADDAERPLAAAVGWIDNPLALPAEADPGGTHP